MEIAGISYWIHDYVVGKRMVSGWAIDSRLPVRICIRLNELGDWVCEHFDSGYRFGNILPSESFLISEVVDYAIRTMGDAIATGAFVKACEKIGFDADTIESFFHQ